MVVDKLADHPDQIDLSPYAYVGNNPISKTDPDGNCPHCLIGAAIGAIFGGGVEAISQIAHSGHITSWKAVGGSALQGAITGAVAGATGGASLLVTVGTSAAANVVGGVANNTIQGKAITVKSVATDAVVGAAAGLGGKLLEKGAAALQVAKTGKALTTLAADAKANVTATGLKEGEKGFGQAAHSEFKSLVDAKGLKGVSTEVSYVKGAQRPYGTAGSSRADVVLSRNGAVSHVFDLKTGSATLSTKQINNYIKNVPGITKAAQVTAIR